MGVFAQNGYRTETTTVPIELSSTPRRFPCQGTKDVETVKVPIELSSTEASPVQMSKMETTKVPIELSSTEASPVKVQKTETVKEPIELSSTEASPESRSRWNLRAKQNPPRSGTLPWYSTTSDGWRRARRASSKMLTSPMVAQWHVRQPGEMLPTSHSALTLH